MEAKPNFDSLSNFQAAVQYLTWALEEIEKFGSPEAAVHARSALEELRSAKRRKASAVLDDEEDALPF